MAGLQKENLRFKARSSHAALHSGASCSRQRLHAQGSLRTFRAHARFRALHPEGVVPTLTCEDLLGPADSGASTLASPATHSGPSRASARLHTRLSPSATLQLLGHARGRPLARPRGVVAEAGLRGNPRDRSDRGNQVEHAPSGAGVTSLGAGGVAGLRQVKGGERRGHSAPVPPTSRQAYSIRSPL